MTTEKVTLNTTLSSTLLYSVSFLSFIPLPHWWCVTQLFSCWSDKVFFLWWAVKELGVRKLVNLPISVGERALIWAQPGCLWPNTPFLKILGSTATGGKKVLLATTREIRLVVVIERFCKWFPQHLMDVHQDIRRDLRPNESVSWGWRSSDRWEDEPGAKFPLRLLFSALTEAHAALNFRENIQRPQLELNFTINDLNTNIPTNDSISG